FVLTKLSRRWRKPLSPQSCLAEYIICLARLGGYLARAQDPPPGNLVIWRGIRRLSDLLLGAQIAQNCGYLWTSPVLQGKNDFSLWGRVARIYSACRLSDPLLWP